MEFNIEKINLVNFEKKNTKGTSCPASIVALHFLPSSEPEATSARINSPELRWVSPYFCDISSH
jgi:hypothetical protein